MAKARTAASSVEAGAGTKDTRTQLAAIVESHGFVRFTTVLIFLNAILIGAETYPQINGPYGAVMQAANAAILLAFTIEIVLRFIATPAPRYRFFTDGWNLFDVIIVGGGFLPAGHFVSAARLLRVLRLLRAVTVAPSLRRLISGLIRSVPSMMHVILLILLINYIYAVVGTILYGGIAPGYFGTLDRSLLTLFGVLTLEGWVDVMREVMAEDPSAWAFFISYVALATFVTLNLIVGIIVNSMQEVAREDEIATAAAKGKHVKPVALLSASEQEQLLQALERIERRLDELGAKVDGGSRATGAAD